MVHRLRRRQRRHTGARLASRSTATRSRPAWRQLRHSGSARSLAARSARRVARSVSVTLGIVHFFPLAPPLFEPSQIFCAGTCWSAIGTGRVGIPPGDFWFGALAMLFSCWLEFRVERHRAERQQPRTITLLTGRTAEPTVRQLLAATAGTHPLWFSRFSRRSFGLTHGLHSRVSSYVVYVVS
jgi:hypothetical protein